MFGLGLLEVAAVTRSQQLVPATVRGRAMGAVLAVNAISPWVRSWPPGPYRPQGLMAALPGALLLLALGWPRATRADRR